MVVEQNFNLISKHSKLISWPVEPLRDRHVPAHDRNKGLSAYWHQHALLRGRGGESRTIR